MITIISYRFTKSIIVTHDSSLDKKEHADKSRLIQKDVIARTFTIIGY